MDKNRKIYVFGHKKPDTDSICACITYTHLKWALGFTNVEAVCLGEPNKETQFALNYFNMEPPRLIQNIKPQISDLNYYPIPNVYADDSVKKAWDAMVETSRQMLPILHTNHKLAGVITISDIAKTSFGLTDGDILKKHKTPFVNVISVLNAKVLKGRYPYAYVKGDIFTTACIADNSTLTDGDIVLTGSEPRRIDRAINSGAGCVIVTDMDARKLNYEIPESYKGAVLCTKLSFFKTIRLITQSISLNELIQHEDITFFQDDEYIDDVRPIMLGTTYRHFPIVDKEGRVLGLISKRHLLNMDKKQVILVDHNERSQSADGIEQAEILEIIDHHRVANLDTGNPVFLRAEPVGCTNTIIGKMFEENNIMPPKEIAGLMLSAILSDTLIFKSPTCTSEDIRMAKSLAEIAEVDLYAYGSELLAAGTSIEGITPNELLNIDRKVFNVGKYAITVAQINTADFKSLYSIKDDLLKEMQHIEKEENLDLFLFMATDIVIGGTELFISGKEKSAAMKLFGVEPGEDSIFLADIFSRKKQIVPKLMSLA